jgi:hypothetical protein
VDPLARRRLLEWREGSLMGGGMLGGAGELTLQTADAAFGVNEDGGHSPHLS